MPITHPLKDIIATPDVLRERREAAGLTQTQLAQLAGCSLATLGNMERGYIPRRSPTLTRVLATLAELRRAAFEGRTRNDLRDLFGRHRTAADLDRALASLAAAGSIREEIESTAGRPRTRYLCAESVKSAESTPKQGLTAHTALTAQGQSPNGEVKA